MQAAMHLASVNVGEVRAMDAVGEEVSSAIVKRPVRGAVALTADGLAGDQQANLKFHGGPDQAVYVYSADDYRWWSEQTGRECHAGLFGENLTIEGLPDNLGVGDRLVVGTCVMEVTGPRIPCSKIALVTKLPDFVQDFRAAERPGAYLRVLHGGKLSAGDAVSIVAEAQPKATVREVFRLYYDGSPPRDTLERILQAPLASRLRARFSKRLEDA